MEKEPITTQGLQNLKKELDELKNIKRPKIIEAIAEARAHGDLKENAEYHAAREEQAKTESRIIEINDLIARANVIDVTKIKRGDNVITSGGIIGTIERVHEDDKVDLSISENTTVQVIKSTIQHHVSTKSNTKK